MNTMANTRWPRHATMKSSRPGYIVSNSSTMNTMVIFWAFQLLNPIETESYDSLGGSIILPTLFAQKYSRHFKILQKNILHCTERTQNKTKKAKWRLLLAYIFLVLAFYFLTSDVQNCFNRNCVLDFISSEMRYLQSVWKCCKNVEFAVK